MNGVKKRVEQSGIAHRKSKWMKLKKGVEQSGIAHRKNKWMESKKGLEQSCIAHRESKWMVKKRSRLGWREVFRKRKGCTDSFWRKANGKELN